MQTYGSRQRVYGVILALLLLVRLSGWGECYTISGDRLGNQERFYPVYVFSGYVLTQSTGWMLRFRVPWVRPWGTVEYGEYRVTAENGVEVFSGPFVIGTNISEGWTACAWAQSQCTPLGWCGVGPYQIVSVRPTNLQYRITASIDEMLELRSYCHVAGVWTSRVYGYQYILLEVQADIPASVVTGGVHAVQVTMFAAWTSGGVYKVVMPLAGGLVAYGQLSLTGTGTGVVNGVVGLPSGYQLPPVGSLVHIGVQSSSGGYVMMPAVVVGQNRVAVLQTQPYNLGTGGYLPLLVPSSYVGYPINWGYPETPGSFANYELPSNAPPFGVGVEVGIVAGDGVASGYVGAVTSFYSEGSSGAVNVSAGSSTTSVAGLGYDGSYTVPGEPSYDAIESGEAAVLGTYVQTVESLRGTIEGVERFAQGYQGPKWDIIIENPGYNQSGLTIPLPYKDWTLHLPALQVSWVRSLLDVLLRVWGSLMLINWWSDRTSQIAKGIV